ncbi:YkvA family protein [Spirulina sp. CS-785/01]|uniref:YkvA family protein n=1 Tax=Spirulina sp. CS-785/01 TaxID=3021716 RepID=UPI00232FB6E5|nr:YkvA family protein [Spirulina sp. CS-785/01]
MVNSFYQWYRRMLRHNKYRWVIILATVAYFISPFDLSPDVFPIVGWLDDGILVTLLLSELGQMLLEQRKTRQTPADSIGEVPQNSVE